MEQTFGHILYDIRDPYVNGELIATIGPCDGSQTQIVYENLPQDYGDLKKGKKYFWRIRAIDANGEVRMDDEWSFTVRYGFPRQINAPQFNFVQIVLEKFPNVFPMLRCILGLQ